MLSDMHAAQKLFSFTYGYDAQQLKAWAEAGWKNFSGVLSVCVMLLIQWVKELISCYSGMY